MMNLHLFSRPRRLSCLLLVALALLSTAPADARQDGAGQAAGRAFAEGEELRARGTAEAIRRAVEQYREALRLRREAKDRAGESAALTAIGVSFQMLREYDKAAEHYEQALSIFRELGGRPEEGIVLYNLGGVHLSLSRFDRAVEYYERALVLHRRFNNRAEEGDTLAYLGGAYGEMGRYEKAVEYLEQALRIQRTLGRRREEGVIISNLGAAYSQLGRHEKALEFYAQAQTALGRFAEAVEVSGQALAIHRATRNRLGEGRTYDAPGEAHRMLGQLNQSVEDFKQSLVIMREINAPGREANAFGELMRTWKEAVRPRLAIFYGKQAVNAYQQIRSNLQKLDKETQRAFAGSKQDAYRVLAGLLISEGRLGEAQQVLGMLKEDEYFEFVSRDGGEASTLSARATLTPEEAAEDERYRAIADRVAGIGREWSTLLAKQSRTPAEEARLSQLEKDLEVANKAFQKFLDQLSEELGTSQKGGDRVYQLRESEGLKEVLRELGSGAVALYTIVGEEKYRVILFTPDVQLAREYPIKAQDLYAKIIAFREALQNPKSDPRPLARELYRILIGPVAKAAARLGPRARAERARKPLTHTPSSGRRLS